MNILKKIPAIFIIANILLFSSCGPKYQNDDDKALFEVDPKKYKNPADQALFYAVKGFDVEGVEAALVGDAKGIERVLEGKGKDVKGNEFKGKNFKMDANPDVSDRLGQSALMWACWNGRLDIVKLLTDKKSESGKNLNFKASLRPNINNPSERKYTAILCAAYQGDSEIFQYLIKSYTNINFKVKDDNDENILHKIAKSGNIDLLKYIPPLDELVDATDKSGYTPLHIAVNSGNFTMVDELLSMGANPMIAASITRKDEQGNPVKREVNPLFSAYNLKYYRIFVSLLKNIKDPFDIEKIIEPNLNIPIEEYIKSEVGNSENSETTDNSQDRYLFSLLQRKKGIEGDDIEEPEFKNKVNEFYKAIEEDVSFDTIKKLGDFVIADINKYGREGSIGKPLLITALEVGNLEVLTYLLTKKYQTIETNDLLCTAAAIALGYETGTPEKENYNKILRYLLANINRFDGLKRLNGKDPKTGNTTLMYIVQNVDFLDTFDKAEDVIKIFKIYPVEFLIQKNYAQTWVISDIIDTTSKYRDNMFEFISNVFIKNNQYYPTGNEKVLYLVYAKRYWYGINYLINLPKADVEGLLTKVDADPDLGEATDTNPETREKLTELKIKLDNIVNTLLSSF
jgi:hypothetical protein